MRRADDLSIGRIAIAAPGRRARAGFGEPGRMRSADPPPGRPMTFPEWSAAIAAGVRCYIPQARAARKGSRLVIIRHAELEARLVDDRDAFVISFRACDSTVTMSSLVDRDRLDAFTV